MPPQAGCPPPATGPGPAGGALFRFTAKAFRYKAEGFCLCYRVCTVVPCSSGAGMGVFLVGGLLPAGAQQTEHGQQHHQQQ